MKNLHIKRKTVVILLTKLSILFAIMYWLLDNIKLEIMYNFFQASNSYWLVAAFVMLQISLFFSALRSKYYFHTEKCNLGQTLSVALYYIGMLFNLVLPGGIGGDGYRIYLIYKLRKFPKLSSLKLILYERINGLYALIILTLILFPYSDFVTLLDYGMLLNLFVFIITTPCYLYATRIIFKDNFKRMIKASSYSFIVQIFQILFACCVVEAIVPQPDFKEYINYTVLFSISSFVAILPISVGSVGLREMTFLYGSKFMDISPELGVAYAMTTFLIYALTALFGIPFYFGIKKINQFDRSLISVKTHDSY